MHWKLALLVCCLHSSLEVGKKMRGGTLCKKLTVKLGEERKRSERQMKTLAACLEIAHCKRHTRSTLDNLPENSNQTEHQCRLLLSLLRLLFAFFFFFFFKTVLFFSVHCGAHLPPGDNEVAEQKRTAAALSILMIESCQLVSAANKTDCPLTFFSQFVCPNWILLYSPID